MLWNRRSTLVLVPFFLTACAGGANVVRPQEDTAQAAIGEHKCDPKHAAGDSEPFVVDWSDKDRSALESAMSRGVAVVKYSCVSPAGPRCAKMPAPAPVDMRMSTVPVSPPPR